MDIISDMIEEVLEKYACGKDVDKLKGALVTFYLSGLFDGLEYAGRKEDDDQPRKRWELR